MPILTTELRGVEALRVECRVVVSYEAIRDWVSRFGTQISALNATDFPYRFYKRLDIFWSDQTNRVAPRLKLVPPIMAP